MLLSANDITNEQLETARFALNALFVIATSGVWLGVYWENEKFPEAKRNTGWRLLVVCLGAETLFGGLMWQADSAINRRQKAEISSLELQIAPRRLSAQQQDSIKGRAFGNGGKVVLVESYALDAESATLGKQIESALSPQVQVQDALMADSTMGSINFGIHITGPDKKLVKLLLDAFRDVGLTATDDPITTGAGFATTPNGHVDATIFVGIKPVTQ